MPIAVRKPQPSSPRGSMTSPEVDLILSSACDISTWVWIECKSNFELTHDTSLTALNFVDFDDIYCDISTDIACFDVEFVSAKEDLKVDVFNNFTEQLKIEEESEEVIDPGDTAGRLNALERDLTLSSQSPAFYKEFEYSGEDLTGYSIYTASNKSTKLFSVVFNFVNSVLTSKVITRESDGSQLTVTFNYDGDNLVSQTRTIQ